VIFLGPHQDGAPAPALAAELEPLELLGAPAVVEPAAVFDAPELFDPPELLQAVARSAAAPLAASRRIGVENFDMNALPFRGKLRRRGNSGHGALDDEV
jgi:hypothetical protein